MLNKTNANDVLYFWFEDNEPLLKKDLLFINLIINVC